MPSGPLSAATAGPAAIRLIETRDAEARTARSRPVPCITNPPQGHARSRMRGRYNWFAEREFEPVGRGLVRHDQGAAIAVQTWSTSDSIQASFAVIPRIA